MTMMTGLSPSDMGWRINTRASLQGSRHEDSGWIDQDSWNPSDGYIHQPGSWLRFGLGVLMVFLACLAFAVGLVEVMA